MTDTGSLLAALERLLTPAHLLLDQESRQFFSTDVFRAADYLPVAVARPGTIAELQQIVRLCASHGVPMVVRGGGASYTDAYLPALPNMLTIDVSRLKGIEVDTTSLTVTVEPGVTWAEMHAKLKPLGLRTPMWGPFSGLAATVGGGMSHYAVNYGSGLYGVSAESLLGLDVILANGDLLSTGSGGGTGSLPFFRFYGPDLTGIFVGDAGAFGIKARLTLRLIRTPTGFAAASFGFPDGESCLKALMEVAPLGVVAQNFGLDPRQQKTALTRMESADPLQAAKSVFLSSRNPLDGAIRVLKLAAGGRNFLKDAVYSAHFGCEGQTAAEAKAKLAVVRDVAGRYGAEVANSIPTYFQANPFMELLPILGPNGERWKPTHGVLPFAAVLKHHAEYERLLAEYRDRMKQHRVQLTRMLMFFSSNAFIYEPTFLWEDARTIYHRRVYPPELLPKVPEHAANPAGRALVHELKGRIQELCSRNGASHLQVGKDYPYLPSRKPETRELVRSLKRLLDPQNLMNPGALGL